MNEMEDYINNLKKTNTKIYYRLALEKYFKAIETSSDDYFKNKEKKMTTYENDLKKFVTNINKLAPVTQKNYISVIKNFFIDNDVEFSNKFWKREVRNKIEDGGALTLDRAPTTEELKKILSYGDLKDRALFTFLATSGMRIGEALQIQLSDIDLKYDPGKINIRSTYVKGKKKPRWTFISDECKNLLQAWLEVREYEENGYDEKGNKTGVVKWTESERERYLRITTSKIKSCRPQKSSNDTHVFPFTACLARRMWYDLIHKAGVDQKSSETDRYELHLHAIRKFFMSELKLELPEVIVEAYAGHSKYLDEAYKRYSLQQLADFYKKGMHRLLIFETQPDLSGINEQLAEVTKENMHMKADIEKMHNEILTLQNLETLAKLLKKT
jgi:integrase